MSLMCGVNCAMILAIKSSLGLLGFGVGLGAGFGVVVTVIGGPLTERKFASYDLVSLYPSSSAM